MKFLKSIPAILDGNKTILSLLLGRLFGAEFANDLLDPEAIHAVKVVFDLCAAAALGVHAKKGAFKKDTTIAPKVQP